MTSTNNVDTQAEEQIREKDRIFDSWFSRWFIYRIPATIVWLWFFLRFLNIGLPNDIPLSRETLLLYPLLAWISMLFMGRWIRFILHPLYIIFVPPTLISIFLVRIIWRASKLPIEVTKFALSTRLVLILFLFVLVGWFATLITSNYQIKAWSSLFAHISFYILFLQSFRWATTPYRPIIKLFDLSGQVIEFFIRTNIEVDASYDGVKIWIDWARKLIDLLVPDEPDKRGFSDFAKSHLISFAIYGFIFTYALIATSFSFTHFYLEKVYGSIISGLGAALTIYDYLYFSFASQATAVPDGIAPNNIFGQIWIIWLIMTGVLLLTALIGIFTTSVGMQGNEAIEEISKSLKIHRARIDEWEKSLTEGDDDEIIDADFRE